MHTLNQQVLDLVASHGEQNRVNRQVSTESVQALKDCGFYKMLLPKQWGGLEHTPQEFFAEQILLAEADMSTAWISGIIAVHAFQIAIMADEAQQDVYGKDPNTLVSSSYNPVGGKVTITEGGFKLSGRWGWSSGSEHCEWALLGAIVHGEGYRTFLVPRSDYRIEDTWHVMGLQGTGSNDIVIDEPVFVPGYRTHKRSDGYNCVNNQSNPMYSMPWAQTFIRVVNTPAIGALKKALKLFIETRTAAASTDTTKLAADAETQTRVATVKNTIHEIESILFNNFNEMQANNWRPSVDQRILYRYQASIVIDKCIEAIDTLFDVAGGRSVFLGHPLQQIWNDIHIARAHVANSPAAFARNLGSTLLGLDNTDYFI
ncbi:MAG: flavin-dependent monooxygenase [Gammaproteobacteria bacterium]|uniref:flavin-dependent monooxygenase n=1 Tax=Pseudomaricurvus alcaniphilus TaxID=1166482 RepID=UPI00140B28D0|nr:flavin-dependent monooxygenase [Pseudomaricurvus alcaniphilus]MBR9912975.1 flavin-dependent monooxygenase [Gammaproteobacteria bacterium]NHN36457.1 flavin-dependent monooxygenase [Pseudomaricurvus alcaniphilus]